MNKQSFVSKFKYMFLAFVLAVVGALGLVGCGDIYANVHITVSTNQVSLYLDDINLDTPETGGDEEDTGEGETTEPTDYTSAIITATLEGASDDMLKSVDFWYKDNMVVTAEVVSLEENVSTIRLTAKNPGSTIIRIISNESSQIVSEDITVNVFKQADSMQSLNQSVALEVGHSLTLETGSLIGFTPSRVYPSEATFSIMSPTSPLWNSSYGVSPLNGVSISDNTLIASPDADTGIVQIEASMPYGISCAIYVLIYEPISQESIHLMQGETELEELLLTINSSIMNSNTMSVVVDEYVQNYSIRLSTADTEIAYTSAIDTDGSFTLFALDSGATSLDVNIDLIDPVTQRTYITFTRTYDVLVWRIADQVIISGGNTSPTTNPVNMDVQDYYDNIRGAEVNIKVGPEGAINRNFEIVVTEIDGEVPGSDVFETKLAGLNIQVTGRSYADIKNYAGYQNYEYGELLRNDTTFYVSLAAGSEIVNTFTLEMRANTFDPTLPVVVNTITFSVRAGVIGVTPSTDTVRVAVDNNAPFSLNFSTSLGPSAGNPRFTVTSQNPETATVEPSGVAYSYVVNGISEGSTYITITAESGVSVTLPVFVYIVPNEFYLMTERSTSNVNIAEETWQEAEYINPLDGLYDRGVTAITVREGAVIDVACISDPASSQIDILIASEDDATNSYLRLYGLNEDNTFSFIALNATDTPIDIIVQFSFNRQTASGWELVTSERRLSVTIYKPLNYFYWDGTREQTNITLANPLYDINSLYYEDVSSASATLNIFLNDDATALQYGGIEWTVRDPDLITIVSNGRRATITANLSDQDTLNTYETVVYASVREYRTVHTISCTVRIVRPTLVENIEVTNYDNNEGIRLRSEGTTERTTFTINTSLTPRNPYDTRLGYKIYNAELDASGLPVATTEYIGDGSDAIITFDPDTPNRIIAQNAGYAVVRIYPLDRVNSSDVNYDEIYHIDVWVVVEDGITAPYSIYTPEDFIAIGSSADAMTKDYTLMQTIDLSNYASYLPLGKDLGVPFSGSLNSYRYEYDGHKQSIIGITLPNEFMIIENSMLTGLFGSVSGNIRNIDFTFSQFAWNLADALAMATNNHYDIETIDLGVLAGVVDGDVENVAIRMTDYTATTSLITGVYSDDYTLSFGALAGRLNGSARGVYTNLSLRTDIGATVAYVGGLVGVFSGNVIGWEDEVLSRVNLTLARETYYAVESGVGGLVGYIERGSVYSQNVLGTIVATLYDNVGGLVGRNAGTLGLFSGNVEYKNIIGVKTQGHNNVGGIAGYNTGTINYSRAENYEDTDATGVNQAMASGINYVGGLVGYSEGGRITYSYAMGYVTQEFTADGNYTGDVMGENYVGGLIGYAHNTYLTSVFAKNNILVNGAGISGGLIGEYLIDANTPLTTSILLNAYSNGQILTSDTVVNGTSLEHTGELIGIFTAYGGNNYIDTCYSHVYIQHIPTSTMFYNLIADNVNGGNVTSSYYLATTTNPSLGSATHEDMIVQPDNNFNLDEVYIGWGFGGATSGIAWVQYDPDYMDTVNDNLPLLYDYDRGWLYNQAIRHIDVTPLTLTQEGDLIPTFTSFQNLGSIVMLDNIRANSNGQYVLDIYNTGGSTPNGLFDIVVSPQIDVTEGSGALIDPSRWMLSVTSSNPSIAEVVQDSLSVLGAYIIFKSTGTFTLTFQSLLDVNARVEVEVNVISGFNDYDVLDENDESITAIDQNVLSIKKYTGKLLIPTFTRNHDINYYDTIGISYSTHEVGYFEFTDYPFVSGANYIPYTQPNLLGGLEATLVSGGIEVTLRPYAEVTFGGQTYYYTFDNIAKNFYCIVYNGITQAGFNAEVSDAVLESGGTSTIRFDVFTDNTSAVTLSTPTVRHDGEIVDTNQILSILAPNIDTNVLYTQQYLFRLADEDKAITEDQNYDISITVSDESGVYGVYTFRVTFTPSSISYIDIEHFTYGPTSMENGEASSNLLSPGTMGILRIDVTPEYAYYDYLLLASSIDSSTGQRVQLQQMVYRNGRYTSIPTQYNTNGALIVNKITGYDASGNQYYNGILYVSTLVGNYFTEGYNFTISVTAMRDGEDNYVFAPQNISLVTTFAPHATLTLDSDNGDAIGKGTVANLRLTGELLNSTLVLSASYGISGTTTYTDTQLCAFDPNLRLTYGTGARETVDIIIPFYVGIDARPAGSEITITVTINSTTATGGLLNPIVLEYTIYIADYEVDSIYTYGAENGTLNATVRTYTTLRAVWTIVEPSIEDYRTFISGDEDAFNESVARIRARADSKLCELNELGEGQGGAWYYNDGNGYVVVQPAISYRDFIITYTTMNDGNSYYLIRGITNTLGIPFMLSVESYYIYDETEGCYTLAFRSDLENVPQENILMNYSRLLEQTFVVDIVNNSTADTPDLIDSVEKFRGMQAGSSNMLTTDIVLENWTPIDTAIASLDGNGHVIYLRSFSANTSEATANYGLFSTLQSGTVLKNLIVDVSYNIFVDLEGATDVNFGYLAGVVSEGAVIYNCDVVVTQSKEDWRTIYNNTPHAVSANTEFAFANSVFTQMLESRGDYVNYRTLASTFVLTDISTSSRRVTTNIGGLVGQNNGYITNSRIGRVDLDNALGYNRISPKYAVQGLNIFASGNVGGLVGQNNGVISNSYFANGTIVNYSMSIYSANNEYGSKTGGLVADQTETGRIESSYAVGQLDDTAQSSLGGIIAYGTIGGLVHSNAGIIRNSYSNVSLSSSNAIGGFVYENIDRGEIRYCYSMSKINSTGLINGVFVGANAEGTIQNGENATVEYSYYYSTDNVYADANEPAQAISASEWSNAQGLAFDGFVIADNDMSTWYINPNKTYLGPQLRFADKVYYSHRSDDYTYDAGYELGTEYNPAIITSLTDWQKIFYYADELGTLRSPFMERNPAYASSTSVVARYIFGDYYVSLLADIDFNSSIDETAYDTIFTGKFLGNGYSLTGLNYRYLSATTSLTNDFGVFDSLDGASVMNLNLEIETEINALARHVGTLAGSIADSFVENIYISGTSSASSITGRNMTGALAGYVSGDSEIRNIFSEVSVNSIGATIEGNLLNYYTPSQVYRDYSYAGGVIGVIDLNFEENAQSNPRIQNLVVSGNVDIFGETVGGVVGLLSESTEAKGLRFILGSGTDVSASIRGANFAGGLVGENRGQILNSYIALSDSAQIALDSGINSSDDPRNYIGYTGLFANTEQTSAIAVGGLVGLNIGGLINNSYSRVSVIANNSYIVGGIIGMSIQAPAEGENGLADYDDTSGSVLSYLRNLSLGSSRIFESNNIASYAIESDGRMSITGEFRFGAILNQVYTTGALNGGIAGEGSIIGGVVGAMIGAPVLTNSTEALISAVINYDTTDRALLNKVDTEGNYFGSVIGYLGFNVNTLNNSGIIPFVSTTSISGDRSLANSASNVKATTSIGNVNLHAIGNLGSVNNEIANISVYSTSFLTSATSVDDRAFNGFNDAVWNLDSTKTAHRFPILNANYSATVSEIDTVEELFDFLENTNRNSYGRITADLVINGADWTNRINAQHKNTIATDWQTAISGRLEGAVPIEVSGQETTTSATITLRNFNSTVAGSFDSFFGYLDGFRLLNVNFVFDFSPVINGDANDTLITSVGLLAQESRGSTFENVNIRLLNENTLVVNRVDNIALVTGTAQNCSFVNVNVQGGITATDFTANLGVSVNIGSLFGSGTVTNTINGTQFGSFTLDYSSTNNYALNIGGLGGLSSGILSSRAVLLLDQPNIEFNVNLTADNNDADIRLGGLFGSITGSGSIQNVLSSGSLNVSRANNSSNSNAYIGGIVGLAENTSMSNVRSASDIVSNINGDYVYLGGLIGSITNAQEFTGTNSSMQFNGYTITNAVFSGSITHNATQNTRVYAGGIAGFSQNNLVMANATIVPVGQPRLIFDSILVSGNITINTSANYIYGGGLLGNVIQGRFRDGVYTELDRPNGILRISDSAFVGRLEITNSQSSNSRNLIGGIAGNTQLAIYNTLSNGVVSFDANSAITSYIGGIAGVTNIDIAYSISISNVASRMPSQTDELGLGAIVGVLDHENARVLYSYYSGELCGITDLFGTNLTAMQMLDASSFTQNNANLFTDWTYATSTDTQSSFMYPITLDGVIDTTRGSAMTPVFVSDINMLTGQLADTTTPNKVIYVNTDKIDLVTLPNLEIANARKIVGNGVIVEFAGIRESSASGNIGLFSEIPKNVVVSSITLNISKVEVTGGNGFNLGILAGVNNGAIYNCSVGGIPEVTVNNATAASFEDLTLNWSDNYTGLTTNDVPQIVLNIQNPSGISVGSLVGENLGSITAVFANVDIYSSGGNMNIGGIAGSMSNAILNNSLTEGRIVIDSVGEGAYIGGLAGYVENSYIFACIANGNIIAFNNIGTNIGLAFGEFSGFSTGVIVNSDISGNLDNTTLNTYYNTAYTTQNLLNSSTQNSIFRDTTMRFNEALWSYGDATLNYGYPYLNTLYNIDFSTGSGSLESPFEIREASEFTKITQSTASGRHYILIRDVMISESAISSTSSGSVSAASVSGNGNVVLIESLPNPTSSGGTLRVGLFGTISANTLVSSLAVVINDSQVTNIDTQIYFGGLASENRGTITDCAVESLGSVEFSSLPNSRIGGLVGVNSGAIRNSWANVNIIANDGYIGGLVGLLGTSQSASSRSTASILNSFATGNLTITQNTQNSRYTDTSVGGLVGLSNAEIENGHSIENCYAYSNRILVASPGSNVGALIGNAVRLNTIRTYAYVYTPGANDTTAFGRGNYADMGMIGNTLEGAFDSTSIVAVWRGENDGERMTSISTDVSNVLPISTLRSTDIGNGCYVDWRTSIWTRNRSVSGTTIFALYLDNVTPVDKQERNGTILTHQSIFEYY